MAQRRQGQSWAQVAVIILAALLLVAGIYALMEWQQRRPTTPMRDVHIEVSSAGQLQEIAPYAVCELDQECDGGEPPTIALDTATVTINVPPEISGGSWRLLTIYDDPAANDEVVFTSGEATSHEVAAVTDSGAKLVVAEVSALAIEKGDDGEEIPVIATWSIGFE